MTPPTVNAYYNPQKNEIVFPAGILQPPFFDAKADDAVNYGAMGAVIGHEMTHGFDDQGRKFDAQGNLRDWWTPEDLKNYQERSKCVEDQYDSYVYDGPARQRQARPRRGDGGPRRPRDRVPRVPDDARRASPRPRRSTA